jgi:hypothetical protein
MTDSPRFDRLVLAVGTASVAAALALRVWHRGANLPGWDILLATEGQFLIATQGWWGALRETLYQTRHFFLPPAAYSVPYGLVPGALNRVVPWLYWQPLVVATLWLVTLPLLLRASGWPLASVRGVGLLLLAWGAWPAALSYAVAGYPWASCVLVYAIALLVVLHPRARQSLFWTALGGALVYELPWHGYELGKTVGCVFALAALLERDVRRPVRALWALIAAVQLADAYWLHETTNIWAFRHGNPGTGIGLQHAFPRLLVGAADVFRRVFVTSDIALPILTTAGAASLFLVREHRALLAALWLLQLGLVVLLAASGAHMAGTVHDLLRSRRYLLVETISLVAILSAARTAPARLRVALVALLAAGNAWALAQLVAFTRDDTLPRYSLPAVASIESVGWIDVASIAWADELAARVLAGERVVALHSQECPSENFTNPQGVLERIYLRVGHERFAESVVAFPIPVCRYACLPLPAPQVVMAELGTTGLGQTIDLDTACVPKMEAALELLKSRTGLVVLNPGRRFARLTLRPDG